jgi:ring-1,2-phenylacetyl-CoA epoxidase subunit PaaE
MLKFHPLAVARRTAAAEDAVAVTFALPPELREAFRFHAGQHVVLRRDIGGREERRTYSIVNPEGADSLTIGVRVQAGGRMSEEIARAAVPGARIDVMTPNGSFHADAAGGAKRFAAFAAGSGITPVLSIAATALARDPGCRFQLWYGNTDRARTMFLDDVLALKDRYLTRFAVAFVMSREPQDADWFNGRIDGAKLGEFARHDLAVAQIDEFFVCGPGTMGEDLPRALTSLGARGRVHVEHFTPVAAGEPVAVAAAAAPALQHGARGRRDPGRRAGRGTRPAVLLPCGRLLDLPREARLRQRRDGAQRGARGLGGRGGLYSLLPGAADEPCARDQLRRMTATA